MRGVMKIIPKAPLMDSRANTSRTPGESEVFEARASRACARSIRICFCLGTGVEPREAVRDDAQVPGR